MSIPTRSAPFRRVDSGGPDGLREALDWGRRERAQGRACGFQVLPERWRTELLAQAMAWSLTAPFEHRAEVSAELTRLDGVRDRRKHVVRQLRLEGFRAT